MEVVCVCMYVCVCMCVCVFRGGGDHFFVSGRMHMQNPFALKNPKTAISIVGSQFKATDPTDELASVQPLPPLHLRDKKSITA